MGSFRDAQGQLSVFRFVCKVRRQFREGRDGEVQVNCVRGEGGVGEGAEGGKIRFYNKACYFDLCFETWFSGGAHTNKHQWFAIGARLQV